MENHLLSMQDVLFNLGLSNIKYLDRSQYPYVASMLPQMQPEVAQKILDQFPDLANTTKGMFETYKSSLDNHLASNNASLQSCYDTRDKMAASMKKTLDDPNLNLTFEQRERIWDRMESNAQRKDAKDTENKKFLLASARQGLVALGIGVLTLGAALGTVILPNAATNAPLEDKQEKKSSNGIFNRNKKG